MALYKTLKMIMVLLLCIILTSCSEENIQRKPTKEITFVQKDTLIKINQELNNEKRVGHEFTAIENIDILDYDVIKNGHKGKKEYNTYSLLSDLHIDTISNDLGILTQYPMNQHYKDKIIIKSFISHKSFVDSQYTAPKELIDCRVLKDLNTNKVEKIIVYIDSVEYILDANNIQK